MFNPGAFSNYYLRIYNYIEERRLYSGYSLQEIGELLSKCGFDADLYRRSYPDLAAGIPTADASVANFFRYCDDSIRHFPINLQLEGLQALADSRLLKANKARIFSAFFASFCVPWSAMWHLSIREFEKFWLGAIALLVRDFKPYVVTGDSHCHVYCRLFESRGNIYVPIPLICYAASSRGLMSKKSLSGAGVRLARMASVLSKAKFAGPIIFKFGQVDVEFVYDFHRTQVRQIEFDERHWRAYLNKSVENYVVFVAEHFRQLSCRAVGIFPPALADDVLKSGYANAHVAATEGVADLSELVNSLRTLEFPDKVHRTLLHREFNQMLKRRANEAGVPYFDDFGFFLGGDGLLDYAFIPTHRGTDHHLERQATRTVAIRIITKIFSEIGVT